MRNVERATCAKYRHHRGCHEATTEQFSLKFVAFHFSKIENCDFQSLKGFDKGKFPLSTTDVPPSALQRLGGRPPAAQAEYVNKC